LDANKKYKDSIFRELFKPPDKALALYNAITGKNLSKDTPIEMKPIDTVLTALIRNDLSFIIEGRLIVVIEHQSTLNQNMPMRALQYIFILYEIYYKLSGALYKNKRMKIPKPEFYMLYNGTEPYPNSGEMRLSDAFIGMDEGEINKS